MCRRTTLLGCLLSLVVGACTGETGWAQQHDQERGPRIPPEDLDPAFRYDMDELEGAIWEQGAGALPILMSAMRRHAEREAAVIRPLEASEGPPQEVLQKILFAHRNPEYLQLVVRAVNEFTSVEQGLDCLEREWRDGDTAARLMLLRVLSEVRSRKTLLLLLSIADDPPSPVLRLVAIECLDSACPGIWEDCKDGLRAAFVSRDLHQPDDITRGSEREYEQASKLIRDWLDTNERFLYRTWDGIQASAFLVNEDARALGLEVDPDTGAALHPETRQPLCKHEIDELRAKRGAQPPNKEQR